MNLKWLAVAAAVAVAVATLAGAFVVGSVLVDLLITMSIVALIGTVWLAGMLWRDHAALWRPDSDQGPAGTGSPAPVPVRGPAAVPAQQPETDPWLT